MLKKIAVAVLPLAAVAALTGSAQAATVTSGAYTQSTSSLTCTGHVQGDGDGGTLAVKVSGMETRPSDRHFRTWQIRTYAVAEEKTYNGTWVAVGKSKVAYGRLGESYSNDEGTINYSPFVWGGSAKPTLKMEVAGYDDLFRARVVTNVYDDEGVRIKSLSTTQGQCRL